MMRVLSLCTGIGGIDLAAEAAGMRIVGQVEIDEFCNRVLAAHWPDVKRMRDIYEVHGDEFGAIDLVVAGFPCFVAGTMVLTREGYRPIEGIQVGDEVLTHQGRWRPVTSVMKRERVELRAVKALGTPTIVTTNEHPFFVREKVLRRTHAAALREFMEPQWRAAKDLDPVHDFASQVLPQSQRNEHTPAFWWLVGRYLADGWRVRRKDRPEGSGRVVICCAHHEADEVERRIADVGFHATRSREATVTKFHIVRNGFYRFLEPFGSYAHGKTLPGWVLELDEVSGRALLEGYRSGDGYRDTRENGWRITTVSKSLALSMALLAQRAYGVVAAIKHCKMRPKTTIDGREVAQRDFYVVLIPDRNREAFVEGQYGWKPIRSNESLGRKRGTVYNISVADDESYCADGAIVHNCQPVSGAGKRRGAADARWLWGEVSRIIRSALPAWCLLENVPGLISLGLDDVLGDLDSAGYEAAACVYPAAAVGAPHERERVFILGYRANVADAARRGIRRGQASREGGFPAQPGQVTDNGGDGGDAGLLANACSGQRDGDAGLPGGWDALSQSRAVTDAARCGTALSVTLSATLANADQHSGRRAQRTGAGGMAGALGTDAAGEGYPQRPAAECCSSGVEYAGEAGLQRPGRPGARSSTGQDRQAQPCLGDAAHGLPGRLAGRGVQDSTRRVGRDADSSRAGYSRMASHIGWPARPGEAQYEWEAPRTLPASDRTPGRAAKLKALGNAVVPQQCYPLLLAISQTWEGTHALHPANAE